MKDNLSKQNEDLKPESVYESVANLRVHHPKFNQAMDTIREFHLKSKLSKSPQNLLITGMSGAGKTTVFESYVEKYDRKISDATLTKKIILASSIPSPATPNSVAEKMLEDLGDPYPNRGTVPNKTRRLVNLIKDCEIELVMLDEFQNFVDPEKRERVLYKVSEWIKQILNDTKVPFILFGLDSCIKVVKTNDQLSRRFPVRFNLPLFNYEDEKSVSNFGLLLDNIERSLPLKDSSNLSEYSEQFFEATKGLMYSIMWLITEASVRAVKRGDSKITLEDLAFAYNLNAHVNNNESYNPFRK